MRLVRRQYSRITNTASNASDRVALTAGGSLYGANTTLGSLDRFDYSLAAVANVTGATASYSTSSTPALISNTVNAISVQTGVSNTDYFSNEVAVATASSTDLIDENVSTPASAYARHYVKQDALGTSGYTQKNVR